MPVASPAKTVRFSQIKVWLGDSATPTEVFAVPCGFNENSLSLKKDANDTISPDCNNPDAAAWKERDIVSKSASIDGTGVMAMQSLATWRAAWEKETSINCRVEVAMPLADGGGWWAGKFHILSLDIKAQRGNRATAAIKMESDGPVTWVPAAA